MCVGHYILICLSNHEYFCIETLLHFFFFKWMFSVGENVGEKPNRPEFLDDKVEMC